MPAGNISQAIRLIASGTTVSSSYTYYFASAFPAYASGTTVPYGTAPGGSYALSAVDFMNLTSTSESSSAASLTAIDRVAGVSFSYLNSASADIVISGLNLSLFTASGSQVYAFAYQPAGSHPLRSDLWVLQGGSAPATIHTTIQHELLHTVGFRDVQPATGSPIYAGVEDTNQYTIMSYSPHSEEGRFATELQIYDIAGLQAIYGRDDGYNSGDTTISQFTETSGAYSGQDRIFSIWDGGGVDTIDASGLANSALIDLRPGYFSSIGPNAGVQVTAGSAPALPNDGRSNVSIAYGGYIENAKGSGAGDLLIGNLLTNKLEGGAGADVIYAEGADSIHDVGNGTYERVTNSGATKTATAPTNVQTFVSDPTKQQDHLLGGAGDDHLRGGRGNDLIEGGADNDLIHGGGGNDEIWGGDKDNDQGTSDGIDKVDYSAATAQIAVSLDTTGNTPVLTVTDGQGGTDTLHSIEHIIGTNLSDRISITGNMPNGYALTFDAGGGVDSFVGGGGAHTAITLTINGSGGTLTQEGSSGVITLLNFHTMIIGSAFDDEITDLAEGNKVIDGGLGDDEISIDGGRGIVRGGGGDDEISGGAGNDRLFGETGDDLLNGGDGSDYLETYHLDPEYFPDDIVEEDDRLNGGDGADYLHALSHSSYSTLDGGAGNDVIDAREALWVTMKFGAGDGHDMILSDRELGVEYDVAPNDGVAWIDMTTVSKSDVTFIWDPQIVLEHQLPNGNPQDTPGSITRQGDLVIMIESTGDTIHFKNVTGRTTYWNDPSETTQPPFDHIFDEVYFAFIYGIEFADGFIELEDFLGAEPLVSLTFGSVAGYATALDEYRAATDGDDEENQGTSGDDDLRGNSGDDNISGGDGDDRFHGSGGNDAIDGGAGNDRLTLFGARTDFTFARDSETGDVIIEDKTGAEGKIKIKSVEKIYFATDNEEYEPGDLVGFWGTTGDDALVQGNARGNLIYGLAGNDLLRGLDGDDSLYGGEGEDTLEGGAGNDIYHVDHGSDTITEAVGGGSDTIITNVGYTLAAGQEVETLRTYGSATAYAVNLTGNAFANTIVGNAAANILDGKAGADAMWGYAGNDTYYVDHGSDTVTEAVGGGSDTIITNVSYTLGTGQEVELLRTYGSATTVAVSLTGNALANILVGNAAANQLDGKGGADAMWGYGGADTFAFSTALGGGNIDAIIDFAAGTDTIALDDAIFAAVGAALDASEFRIGTAAADADDRIVYNSATGQLFYDADGAGGAAQVQFATLNGAPAITAGDFAVI